MHGNVVAQFVGVDISQITRFYPGLTGVATDRAQAGPTTRSRSRQHIYPTGVATQVHSFPLCCCGFSRGSPGPWVASLRAQVVDGVGTKDVTREGHIPVRCLTINAIHRLLITKHPVLDVCWAAFQGHIHEVDQYYHRLLNAANQRLRRFKGLKISSVGGYLDFLIPRLPPEGHLVACPNVGGWLALKAQFMALVAVSILHRIKDLAAVMLKIIGLQHRQRARDRNVRSVILPIVGNDAASGQKRARQDCSPQCVFDVSNGLCCCYTQTVAACTG